MTDAQVEALKTIHQQYEYSDDFAAFQAYAAEMIGGDGAIVIHVGVSNPIWLAVETDGYIHS
tara:strand:- start:583 stop:768 length:186 start_codon:yes stop_codon:yes gene_type:complete